MVEISDQKRKSGISRLKEAEELRESEENFRKLVENCNDVICTIDSEGLITYISPAVERLFGRQSTEDIGQPFSRHIHPDDLPLVQKRFGEALHGEAGLTDCRVITRSGAVKWVRASHVPILKAGRPMGIQVMFSDITERKLAEEKLRKRSARLELVHHIQSEIPLIADIESVLNQTAESIGHAFGYYKISVNLYDRAANEIEYLTGWNKTGLSLPRGHRQTLGQGLIGKAGLLKQTILAKDVSKEPDYIPYHLTETKAELVIPLFVQDRLIGVLDLQAAEVDAFSQEDIAVLESIASYLAFIIERKRAEETLQESEERYKSLFYEALDGICLADAETGLIIDCNASLAAMVGRDRAELIGRPQAVLHPSTGDQEAFSPTFRQHLADKAGQVLETHIVTKTGEIRDVEIKANLLILRGRKMLQGIFHDITERKRAEKTLVKSEKRFRQLSDLLPQIVFETDIKGNLTFANQYGIKSLGYSPEDFLAGINIFTLVPPENREMIITRFKEILIGSESTAREYRMMRKDGGIFPILMHAATILEDGVPIGIRGIGIDITERKRAEEEISKKNAELEAFVHMVSHDLNNPVVSIQGFCSLLMKNHKEDLNEKALYYIQRMQANAGLMTDLLEDLVELSRIGRIKDKKAEVSVREVITSVWAGASTSLAAQNVEFVSPENLPRICYSEKRLYQIFYNLLSNALKFRDEKRKTKVEIGHQEDKDHYTFFVRDNGIGIEPKYHHKIFESFSQLKDIKSEGTGMGLAIVKKIVEANQGKVWVDSRKGAGSTFYFTIPKN